MRSINGEQVMNTACYPEPVWIPAVLHGKPVIRPDRKVRTLKLWKWADALTEELVPRDPKGAGHIRIVPE